MLDAQNDKMSGYYGKWNKVVGTPYPWLPAFNEIMAEAIVPTIHGDTVYVTSDYSGFEKGNKYVVISILLADLVYCNEWEMSRRIIRQKYLHNRRMSYKKLNDKKREVALLPFLDAAGTINGLCASLIINKKIGGLVTTRHTLYELKKTIDIEGNWNINQFERMVRVTHFVSLLLAGLVKPKHSIIWITDDDEIVGGEARKADCARLVSSFTSAYVKHELGTLHMGTTALNEGDYLEEDFAAIPDLIAGSLSDYMTEMTKNRNWLDSDSIVDTEKMKSRRIISWLTRIPKRLNHINLVFEHLGGSSIGLIPLEIE